MMRSLLFVMLVACRPSTPAPWSPVAATEEVAIADGIVARVAPDGHVDVTLHVTVAETTAAGTVRLAASLDAALRSPHLRLARARAYLVLAHQLVEPQPRQAYEAAHQAFEAIGVVIDSRFPPEHTDWRETNAKLQLETDAAGAAREMMTIARRRMIRYVRLWHPAAE